VNGHRGGVRDERAEVGVLENVGIHDKSAIIVRDACGATRARSFFG
jgi:hypothetical protein